MNEKNDQNDGDSDNSAQPCGQELIRCPHCGALIRRQDIAAGPVKLCPRCGLILENLDLA